MASKEDRDKWDAYVMEANKLMVAEGATFGDVLNRYITFVGVHLVMQYGEKGAADEFRGFAKSIEGGAFSGFKYPGPTN